MKWTQLIQNKIAASAALLSLCALVLVSNYIDRNHTDDVKTTISTLYEDRLIAEVYILKMTRALYEVKEALESNQIVSAKNDRINSLFISINETSDAYLKTKFTTLEKLKANELLQILTEVKTLELDQKPVTLAKIDQALDLLDELSAIQLAESKEIMNASEKLYLSGKTASEVVFVLIVLILIVLQAIVFTSKTIVIKDAPKFPSMN